MTTRAPAVLTNKQTEKPFKEVRIKRDTQTDRNTETKPYFRLRLVTGGYGCLWVVTGAYGCLRMFTSGYGWLRMVTGDSVVQSEAKHYKQTHSALSLHIDHHYL